jgi:hypothetical protein
MSIDPNDPELAALLIDRGLDVLDSHIKDPACILLLQTHHSHLSMRLKERIKDRFGVEQFKKNYPNLCQHLKENFPKELPKLLFCSINGQ